MSSSRDTFYRVLNDARRKGLSERDARRMAHIASKETKRKGAK